MIKVIDILHQIEEKTQQYFEDQASTDKRLKLAKALKNLGNTSLDKRIYKQKKK